MKFVVLASLVVGASLVSAGGGGQDNACSKCDKTEVLGTPKLPSPLWGGLPIDAIVKYANPKGKKCIEAIVTCPHSLGKTSSLYNADDVALATSYTQLYRSLTCNEEGKWKAVDKSGSEKDAIGIYCVLDPKEGGCGPSDC